MSISKTLVVAPEIFGVVGCHAIALQYAAVMTSRFIDKSPAALFADWLKVSTELLEALDAKEVELLIEGNLKALSDATQSDTPLNLQDPEVKRFLRYLQRLADPGRVAQSAPTPPDEPA